MFLMSLGFVTAVDYDNINFTSEEFFNGAVTNTKVLELSTGKLVIFYTKSSDNLIYAKSCDLDGTNCGTESAALGAGADPYIDAFEKEDETGIILIYGYNSAGFYRELNYSFVPQFAKQFNTGDTSYVSAVQTNSTHFAIAYQDTSSGSSLKGIICNLDGSSCGTEQTLNLNSVSFVKLILASDNKLKVAYERGGANSKVASYNLDFSLHNSGSNFNSGGGNYIDMIEASDNKLKIVYRDQANSNKATIRSCDLDGTNCGSEIIYADLNSAGNKIIETSTNKLAMITNNNGFASSEGFIYFSNLTGGNISAQNIFNNNKSFYFDMIETSNNQIIISQGDQTNNKGIFVISEPLSGETGITFNNPQQGDILNNTSFTLNVSFSQITNSTYILNNGTETTLGTNQNESTANLAGIEGLNSITVFTNTSGQLSNSSITFTIDTNAPELNVSLPAEYNFYDIDFTQYISFNDTNHVTCIVFIQQTGNITNCLNDNYTFNLAGNLTLDIIAEDSAGNVNSSLNNSIFVNPFAYFQVQLSNATALTNFTIGGRSDVNGTVTYTTFNDGLVIGENTLEFEKSGYITQDITFNLTDTPPAFNQTYNVSEAEINVFIRDRETNQIITGTNFTLEFIANVGLITSTTTGTATITNVLFQEEEYQLVVTNDANYTTESVFFTFTNKESLDVTVHVQDSTLDNYGVVDVKVVDKFGKAIQGAIVQALQWDTNTSSFIRVSEGLTAEDGKSLLNVILDTKLYIFNAQFGDLTANTSQQFIPTLLNGKEIVIPLDTGPTTETGLFENVLFTITENFDNNTYVSNISFSWNNRDGTDITGCIKYFRVQTSGTRTLLSEDCSTGSVVTDLSVSKMLNSSYYIFAEVGFDQGAGGFYVLQTYKYTPLFDVSNILKQTNLALYILPLLYLLAVFIGMLNPFVGGIGLIVVNIFALILTPQYVNGVTMGFMYFIGGLIMYAGGKRR